MLEEFKNHFRNWKVVSKDILGLPWQKRIDKPWIENIKDLVTLIEYWELTGR